MPPPFIHQSTSGGVTSHLSNASGVRPADQKWKTSLTTSRTSASQIILGSLTHGPYAASTSFSSCASRYQGRHQGARSSCAWFPYYARSPGFHFAISRDCTSLNLAFKAYSFTGWSKLCVTWTSRQETFWARVVLLRTERSTPTVPRIGLSITMGFLW